MMDRDSFPQLLESSAGWPKMDVTWQYGGHVEIELTENHETGSPCVHILTNTTMVMGEIFLNGKQIYP